MPAARLRRRDNRVTYIEVRRTGAEGIEEVDNVEPVPNPTAVVDDILDRRQAFSLPSATGNGSGRDPPPPVLVTMTISQTQATGGAVALAANDPTETVVVAISPQPRQPPPGGHPDGHKGGISQTTQHLLIAAGSIGATIIIVMIILGFRTMRKRGLTLAEALRAGRYQITQGGPPPPPKYQDEYRDTKHANEYGAIRNETVTPPQPAIVKSNSTSSQRPVMALGRSDSFNLNRQPSNRTASSPTQPKSFLLESPPPGRNPSHRRNESATPSSNVLGSNTNNPRRSASTRNTHSIDDEESVLQYSDPPQNRPLSALPPPPTFKQFLFNRPSISGKQSGGGFANVMSRFSWTNSNGPQTPHDPSRDTNSHTRAQGRDSYMTARSSVPRFRTIDSWVNQQTNRLEEQKLKEQFRLTSTSTVSSDSEARDTVPDVPAMPKNVQALRESSAQISSQLPNRRPATPPGPPGLPGRNVKHQRHETSGTVDTAPIFKQHPGTEVRFSTKSAVPSEILDRGRNDNILS